MFPCIGCLGLRQQAMPFCATGKPRAGAKRPFSNQVQVFKFGTFLEDGNDRRLVFAVQQCVGHGVQNIAGLALRIGQAQVVDGQVGHLFGDLGCL